MNIWKGSSQAACPESEFRSLFTLHCSPSRAWHSPCLMLVKCLIHPVYCCHSAQFLMQNSHSLLRSSFIWYLMAKIHFMVLTWLKFQNVNWFIRNTDFPVNSFWKISSVYRPKTPPTTPRSLFWHINCYVPKWKIINMLLDGFQSHDI